MLCFCLLELILNAGNDKKLIKRKFQCVIFFKNANENITDTTCGVVTCKNEGIIRDGKAFCACAYAMVVTTV